jgi:hypothetical protein
VQLGFVTAGKRGFSVLFASLAFPGRREQARHLPQALTSAKISLADRVILVGCISGPA